MWWGTQNDDSLALDSLVLPAELAATEGAMWGIKNIACS